MENFGMNEVRRCDNPNGDDNDPVKSPTSYPVEGKGGRPGRRVDAPACLPTLPTRSTAMREPATHFPGAVDGETGDLVGAPDMQDVSRRLLESFVPIPAAKTKRGVIDGVDPKKLSEAGWGILFAGSDGEAKGILE